MYDKQLVIEILEQILNATEVVLQRFERVESSSFFIDSPEGMEKLDSICMQLIAIGESLKKIDSITGKKLLTQYPEEELKVLEILSLTTILMSMQKRYTMYVIPNCPLYKQPSKRYFKTYKKRYTVML